MRKRVAGYVPETRGGRVIHRVRVEGDKRKRITIPCGPGDPEFWAYYYAARAGQQIEATPVRKPAARTLRAMLQAYLAWLESQVEAGTKSPMTLRQRRSLLTRVADMPDEAGELTVGDYDPQLPPAAMLHIQDQWGSRTAQADNSMKALRSAYTWSIPRGWATTNPAAGVPHVHRDGGGAVPWSLNDVKKFLDHHPAGSMARLWLLLTAFTGARRDDLSRLGRGHETTRAGVVWLDWQPGKKGSAPVSIPMLPQLFEETRASKVIGPTYLLHMRGKPFKNGNVLGNSVQDWTREAGLAGRSSHGLRKALGAILAEAGATQHQIMSVMAHTKPQTSEIYTRSAERSRLAAQAMEAIRGLRLG